MWDQHEAKRNSSPVSSVGGVKKTRFLTVLTLFFLGCSSEPYMTEAEKSLEETQKKIEDVKSSTSTLVPIPRVAPEGWAKLFCSIQLGWERERVHDIMGEPISTYPVQLVDYAVLEDNYEAGPHDFKIEYDIDNLVVSTSAITPVPCESKFKL